MRNLKNINRRLTRFHLKIMNLDCKEISISDTELGCQVTFSEKMVSGEEMVNTSVTEITESTGKYLLLQRSYPEGELDSDFIYYETHNENYIGELTDYEVVVSKKYFELKFNSDKKIKVLINPTEKEYSKLKEILPILTNNSNKITLED